MENHTQGKFVVKAENAGNDIYIKDFHNRGSICKMYTDNSIVSGTNQALANAELICKAVNNHEELLEAIKTALFILEMNDLNDERTVDIRKVFKKATGSEYKFK